MFSQDFAGRILPFDDPAARVFAVLAAGRRKLGRPIEFFDAQIAAIARVHDATLATRNTSDFEACGVRLINPWEGDWSGCVVSDWSQPAFLARCVRENRAPRDQTSATFMKDSVHRRLRILPTTSVRLESPSRYL